MTARPTLPDDVSRVELRDGTMIEVPAPTYDHQNLGNPLRMWLRQRFDAQLRVRDICP